MTCAEYREWFTLYLDEVLEPKHRGELEEHVRACASCNS